MKPERNSVRELKWWGSSIATLLAVLVPFLLLGGVITALRDSVATDRFNTAIGLGIYGPLEVLLLVWPFFVSAALSVRLLVPTFAGAPPRLVAVICTVLPVALGGYLQSPDLLIVPAFVAVAIAWALVMPLPRNDLLSYGPIRGGLLLGLGFGSLAFQFDGLFLAICWCAWRLYKNHPYEVVATAIATAFLPALLIFDDLANHSARQYQVLEIALLSVLAFASLVASVVRHGPETEMERGAEAEPDAE